MNNVRVYFLIKHFSILKSQPIFKAENFIVRQLINYFNQ